MATKTIKATGGDYSTLTAWEAALPATLTEVETAECYDFALADDFAIAGVTTSASNYILITSPVAERHDGRSRAVSGSGFHISGSNSSGTIRLASEAAHVRLEGLEIEATGAGQALTYSTSTVSGSDRRIDKCIIHDVLTGTGYTIKAAIANQNTTIRNSIIYGFQRTIDTRGSASCLMENVTCWRHAAQLGIVSDTELTARNVYSGHTGAAAEDFWTGGGAPTGNNNASSDTSAATDYTSTQTSVAGSSVFTSVTSGSEDFTLVAGANALVDNGATLGSVTDDIIGTARPQNSVYDIGAFERAAAGGGGGRKSLLASKLLSPQLLRSSLVR